MADEYLFISDCHLNAGRPDVTASLANFLKNRAIQARFLFILGDLFDAWIGDDDPATDYAEIFRCFKTLSQNTDIFFLCGNRDFLFHEVGVERIGATLISEPSYLNLGTERIVLLHGDSLCTDDQDYQQFRKTVRTRDWQNDFLSRPLSERQQIAAGLREQSKSAMQRKSMGIMNVNQQTVMGSFVEFDISSMIHGHTHQPAIHHYDGGKTRYVLGDWNPHPSYLSWRRSQGYKLTDYRV